MTKDDLLAIGRNVLRPSDSGDVVDWLEENVQAIPDSPMPGPFRSDRTPWIAEALRIAADPETKLLTVLASIQSGKSLFARLFTCHIVANAPGPTMVLQANDAEAKDFAIRYLRPVWNNCPPVKARLSADDLDRSTTADFDRMTVYCRGIWNEANLQRLSLRYTIADECWMAPPGHLAELSARVTAFGWMGKRIFMSQGGTAGQEFHQLHESTDQRDWHMKCPSCGHLQPWVWEQVRFPEEAKASGTWDLAKVNDGTTYECAGCNTRLPDTNASRLQANASGMFVPTAMSSNKGHIGLHWNSLATMSWGELGVLMLRAKDSSDQYGLEDLRRQFKQKRLALPWSEDGGTMLTPVNASDYALADDWAEEAVITPKAQIANRENAPAGSIPFRTMGIDAQRKGGLHFWATVRRWSRNGQSRLMAFEKVETWTGLDDLARKHGVHKALIAVDSGDQTQAVYAECCRRGWKTTKGSHLDDFAVTSSNGQTTRRFYSDPQAMIVPGQANRVSFIVFSVPAAKDLLHGLRVRKLHTFPRDVVEEYAKQLNSEVRVKDKRTGRPMWILPQGVLDNHALDCEVIALLLAVRWGVVGREATTTEAEAPTT